MLTAAPDPGSLKTMVLLLKMMVLLLKMTALLLVLLKMSQIPSVAVGDRQSQWQAFLNLGGVLGSPLTAAPEDQ